MNGWRPRRHTSANFCSRFTVPGTRRGRSTPLLLKVPPIVELLKKAERWQGMLDRGEVTNRAALARQEETSTNRVAQVLRLLELPGD